MFDLTGKVALVTGAASGIGKESARALANQGAEVIAADIAEDVLADAARELKAEGLEISTCQLDVTCEEDWHRLAQEVATQTGKLHVLVNNAGVMDSKPFMETRIEDFRRLQSINVESIVLGVQAAYGLMESTASTEEHGCSIVNMSSIYGQVGGAFSSAYCVSKAGACMLTKALAIELAAAKIRVNSIHPGAVDTALAVSNMERLVNQGVVESELGAREMIASQTPLARFATPADIAGVVAFLASDASAYMTGSEVNVDGGFTAI